MGRNADFDFGEDRGDRREDRREDRRPHGRRGPRRSNQTPVWVWLLVTAVVAVIMVGGGLAAVALYWSTKQTLSANDVQEAGVNQEVMVGDVGVTVTECVEELMIGFDKNGFETTSGDLVCCIKISIKNHNPSKNVTVSSQHRRLPVTDDLGNTLGVFVGDLTPKNCILNTEPNRVREGEPTADVIMVERPPPSAKAVTVLLDKACYGASGGRIKCVLPIKSRPANFPRMSLAEIEKKVIGKTYQEVEKAFPDAVFVPSNDQRKAGETTLYSVKCYWIYWDAQAKKHKPLKLDVQKKGTIHTVVAVSGSEE